MLYLASRSLRRRMLLRSLHRRFRVVRSSYRERISCRLPPSANAVRNAVGKTRRARLPRGARGIVIGADTFLYVQGRVIGKPKTLSEACRTVRRLAGRSHWVYTGLCLRDIGTGRMRTGWVRTRVTFNPLRAGAIRRIVARMRPLDKAGGYAVQGDGGALIARIDGSRTNVIGLPMELLRRELARFK